MKITIVYDNSAMEGLKSGWGFSCLIENGKKILFDCGDNGESLVCNINKLGIDPGSIDVIALSHEHWDHTGGLPGILKLAKRANVAVPASFSRGIRDGIKKSAALIEIHGMQEISESVYTTGELDSPIGLKEQALAVKTKKGLLVITGCAHPGLAAIIGQARKLGKIYGILGGFHGFSGYEELRGIEMISPCHCTKHAKEIRDAYPENFVEARAGSVFEI